MRTRSFAVWIAVLLAGCSGAETIVRSLATIHTVCPNGVAFFASSAQVPNKYREVALLSIQNVYSREAAREAGAMHRQHAGTLGANGIILSSSLSAANGAKVIGPAIGGPAQRRGMAVAIDIPADSTRVNEACRPAGPVPPGAGTVASQSTILVAPEELMFASRFGGPARRTRSVDTRPASFKVRPFDLSGRTTPESTDSVGVEEPFDSTALVRNPDVRSALANLERLKIVTGAREVRQGLVRLSIGQLAPRAQLEYHLSYLHASYQAALPFGQQAAIELWSQGMKLGEFTNDGLLIGADYATPR